MSKKQSKARREEWTNQDIRQRRISGSRKAALRRYEDPTERAKASARMRAKYKEDAEFAQQNREHLDRLNRSRRGKPRGAKGLSRSPEYKIWDGMIGRCHRPKTKQYKDYGGRGIYVCDEWRGRGGFVQFIDHIGRRPSPELTLGRIDNDGHYEPGNVRWETRVEQMSNCRRTRFVTIRGETMSLTAWARRLRASKIDETVSKISTMHARPQRDAAGTSSETVMVPAMFTPVWRTQ